MGSSAIFLRNADNADAFCTKKQPKENFERHFLTIVNDYQKGTRLSRGFILDVHNLMDGRRADLFVINSRRRHTDTRFRLFFLSSRCLAHLPPSKKYIKFSLFRISRVGFGNNLYVCGKNLKMRLCWFFSLLLYTFDYFSFFAVPTYVHIADFSLFFFSTKISSYRLAISSTIFHSFSPARLFFQRTIYELPIII